MVCSSASCPFTFHSSATYPELPHSQVIPLMASSAASYRLQPATQCPPSIQPYSTALSAWGRCSPCPTGPSPNVCWFLQRTDSPTTAERTACSGPSPPTSADGTACGARAVYRLAACHPQAVHIPLCFLSCPHGLHAVYMPPTGWPRSIHSCPYPVLILCFLRSGLSCENSLASIESWHFP